MSDRTTINVPKSEHTAAGNVKEEYDETWTDVLSFYATYRPQVSKDGLGTNQEPMQDFDTSEVANQLVAEMDAMAFNGQVQDDKADEIIGRIKDLHTEIQKLNERLQR